MTLSSLPHTATVRRVCDVRCRHRRRRRRHCRRLPTLSLPPLTSPSSIVSPSVLQLLLPYPFPSLSLALPPSTLVLELYSLRHMDLADSSASVSKTTSIEDDGVTLPSPSLPPLCSFFGFGSSSPLIPLSPLRVWLLRAGQAWST